MVLLYFCFPFFVFLTSLTLTTWIIGSFLAIWTYIFEYTQAQEVKALRQADIALIQEDIALRQKAEALRQNAIAANTKLWMQAAPAPEVRSARRPEMDKLSS